MEPTTFRFEYNIVKIEATIDELSLKMKMGLRKWDIPIKDIEHFYVNSIVGGDKELIVSYRNPGGKVKRARVNHDTGDIQAQKLEDALGELKPSADLRGKPSKEAFKIMGATNVGNLGGLIAFLIVAGIVLVFTLPMLIHGLADSTPAPVSIADIEEGKDLPSTYVTLQGIPSLDYGIEETTTNKGTTTVKYFFPVVSARWSSTDPVRVVLETGDISISEAEALATQGEFTGIVRNVMLEGLSSDIADYFIDEYNLTLHDDVLLMELDADPSFDLIMFIVINGVLDLIVGIIMLVIWLKSRKETAAQEALAAKTKSQ